MVTSEQATQVILDELVGQAIRALANRSQQRAGASTGAVAGAAD
jgi:hypothetical protein